MSLRASENWSTDGVSIKSMSRIHVYCASEVCQLNLFESGFTVSIINQHIAWLDVCILNVSEIIDVNYQLANLPV